MRKGLPAKWNQFPTQKSWPQRHWYLSRNHKLRIAFSRRMWHGACNR
jgi:hypothetical protein